MFVRTAIVTLTIKQRRPLQYITALRVSVLVLDFVLNSVLETKTVIK